MRTVYDIMDVMRKGGIILKWFEHFKKSEGGQGMVEYGLILVLVSVVAVGALTGIGNSVKSTIAKVSNQIDGDMFTLSETVDVARTFSLTEKPEHHLATDKEFMGTENGSFKYVGSKDTVYIPHTIKGVAVTSYKDMFKGTNVTKVISDNVKVTNMSGMFQGSLADKLDLKSLNASSVTTVEGMFLNVSATTGYAMTEKDTERFNDESITGKPLGLRFIVE